MKLFIVVVLSLFVIHYTGQFIQVFRKMKQPALVPTTEAESQHFRIYPQKPVNLPLLHEQKAGIVWMAIMIVYMTVMLIAGLVNEKVTWSFFLLVFIPLIHSYNMFNLFAVVEGGVLCSGRFAAWKNIKSVQFVPITMYHRFYGNGDEVNNGDELIIRTGSFSTSCIVTSADMKEKLKRIFNEKGLADYDEQKSAK